MKRKVILMMMLVIVAIVGGLGAQTVTSKAAGVYRSLASKDYTYSMPAYYAKDTSKSTYIWNSNLTKKRHNLKNYPRTTWFVSGSYKMTNGRKTGIFYQVQDVTGARSGLVWRGYLTKGVNPKATDINDTTYSLGRKDYYFNAFNREVSKVFPGTTYNVKMSKIALQALGRDLDQDKTLKESIEEAMGTKKVIEIWLSNVGRPTSIAKVKQLILSSGKVRNLTDYTGWSIGVYVSPNLHDRNGLVVLTK